MIDYWFLGGSKMNGSRIVALAKPPRGPRSAVNDTGLLMARVRAAASEMRHNARVRVHLSIY